MTKKILFILFIALTLSLIWGVHKQKVSAHQSGCHRWHSCPSDTGSYTCGDLGYYTYCGTSYEYEDPDYTAQGEENGDNQAEDDALSIENTAEADGADQGTIDGQEGTTDSSNFDASTTCRPGFDFGSPQPEDYVIAFEDSYEDQCNHMYEAAYVSAYTAANDEALAEYEATQDENEEVDNPQESLGSGWMWFFGIFGVAAIVGYMSSKSEK